MKERIKYVTENVQISKKLKSYGYKVFNKKNSDLMDSSVIITLKEQKQIKPITIIISNTVNAIVKNMLEKIIQNNLESFEYKTSVELKNEKSIEVQLGENISNETWQIMLALLENISEIILKQNLYATNVTLKYTSGNTKNTLPLTRIECNYQWMCDNGFVENEWVGVYTFNNFKLSECRIKAVEDVEYGEFRATKSIIALYNLQPNDRLEILKYNTIKFNQVNTQDINIIKSGFICISQEQYAKIDKRFLAYRLLHPFSGETFIIPTSKIHPKNLANNVIKLNYFQRQMLNLSAPLVIEKIKFKEIMTSDALLSEEKEFLYAIYADEKIYEGGTYQENRKIIKILSKLGNGEVQLVPEVTSLGKKNYFKKPLKNKICDLFIGKSEILLKSCRPYAIDEDKDIVRLSAGNMKLLGVSETDQVIVHYRDKSVKAKVLAIDSIEQMKETNIVGKGTEMEIMIGIPAHLRRQLDVDNMNVGLVVERDSSYLFKKNANIQFVPLIALLLTIIQTIDNWILVITCFILCLPFVIYVVFSEERNKVK